MRLMLIAPPRFRWPYSDMMPRPGPIPATAERGRALTLRRHVEQNAIRTRPCDVRSCPARTRSCVRRGVLHRRAHHAYLLPADLPGAAGAFEKRRVLPDGGRGRAGGLSSVPALPAGDGAREPGLERHT